MQEVGELVIFAGDLSEAWARAAMELAAGECLLASASEDLPQALVDRVGLGLEARKWLRVLRFGV